MATYNNRLHGDSCRPCSTTTTCKPSVTKPETDISNISCGTNKILSITIVKDRVVVMLDGCSYMTAPLSVVDSNFCAELAEENKQTIEELTAKVTSLQEQVKALGLKEDKDTVYNDTEIKNRLSKIEEKLKDTL
nr:MAG: hypothetical protein [Enquatrovirus sp.]